MKPIIAVEGLSKRYRIGGRQVHNSLRDTVAGLVRAPLTDSRPTDQPTLSGLSMT
jgi:hypothetical protein